MGAIDGGGVAKAEVAFEVVFADCGVSEFPAEGGGRGEVVDGGVAGEEVGRLTRWTVVFWKIEGREKLVCEVNAEADEFERKGVLAAAKIVVVAAVCW